MENVVKRYRAVIKKQEPEKVLCGTLTSLYTFVSRNPVLILKLNITNLKADEQFGFKLSYRFLKGK